MKHAKDYQFQAMVKADESASLILHDQSILNWTNPVRGADHGIVVLWEDDGLPLAFGTLFNAGSSTFRHSLTSLSEFPLRATYQGKKTWTPTPGVSWREFGSANINVAETEALRTAQIKNIIEQFEFQMYPSRKPQQLIRLPDPLHRFESKKHGVLDGAIIAFAEGNDAEALLILRADVMDRTWKYACARSGFYRMTGSLNGQQVWQVDKVSSARVDAESQETESAYMNAPYLSARPPIADSPVVFYDDQQPVAQKE